MPLVLACQVHALPPYSNNPLFLGGNIQPNVMFTLDDSGSMQWEIMPDDITYFSYLYPRPSGLYGGSDYNNQVPDFDTANIYNALLRSASNNKIYYNPAVTYAPWAQSSGTLWANALITCAPHNPQLPGLGCRNLTANQTVNMSGSSYWYGSGGWYQGNHTFYPAVYYRYNGGSIWSTASYTQVKIISTTATYTGDGRTSRTDCTAGTCTYAQEIQNFANWYTYYRSRILLARAGVGRAFAAQGNNMRVGFAAINKGNSTVDGITNTKVVINGVRAFSGSDRDAFFASLYGHVIPTSATPLRTAIKSVGAYYERTDDKGPWGETPGSTGGTQHECRQNYNILMTDGYWNDGESGVGNADGTAGSTITNHSSPADPANYTYSPVAPFSDGFSNTLADYAMDYWKRDLRTSLNNKVPTNPDDKAFWQHMVTFTAGLGVSGTLVAPLPASPAWPDPTLGNPQKLDDLWHAAVNGHGKFFSAADPQAFTTGLTAALTTINERTGSASAVATNSTKLDANGRTYQAKFNAGDWSGQLLAYPLDANGDWGPLDWDAGVVINSITSSLRVILTKGASDGVEFQYANLTAAQQTELNKNASGTTDGCGPERVAYLRGDAVNEGSGTFTCASTTVINKFRSRLTSKLGDIVNSGPAYVGAPSAGYSDVDHPGYEAFSGSSGYIDRKPMIYVGANDGSLHAFNACIDGIAGCTVSDEGKELLAYVPNMAYANLSRLTDAGYNASHRYFVDGSPMVADADTGTVVAPAWKSVLVGNMNGGGQGYFALNITNPADATKSAPTFTSANAANLLLWEFTNADDADMGYSHNLPPSDPYTAQASQIVKMENGKWAVIVGNGYQSANGKAVLYVLFIKEGEDGVWTLGTDYIKLVADSGTGNGLSTPMPFDADGDGLADVIYAGDLKGNMWKFDVSSLVPASWNVALGGTPLFAAGATNPITSPPVVTLHPNGGNFVLFGTGKYLETSDVTDASVRTMYGVWDDPVAPFATVPAGDLITQTMTISGQGRLTTSNPVNYSTSSPVVKGWKMAFAAGGERLTTIPSLEDGIFLFNSINPSTAPCDQGGTGPAYTLDYLTGSMLASPAFDTDGDGDIDADDGVYAGWEIGFVPGGVTRVRGATKDVLVYSKSDGTLGKLVVPPSAATLRGRVNWRELVR